MSCQQKKLCKHDGCKTRPSFEFEGETKALYCSQHKLDGMIDINNKRCIQDGCKTRPSYNNEGESKAIYCAQHKLDGMIDIKHKRCIQDGCTVQPNYNFEMESKPIYCAEHKLDGMIDIKNKRCIQDGCTITPNFNFNGQTKALYCSQHKLDGMINIISKRCKHDGCKTQPSFNFEGTSKSLYCSRHKLDGMINLINKRCIHDGCTVHPNYNFEMESKPIYCSQHKLDGMIHIKCKRCIHDGCMTIVTRNTTSYKGYCVRCFIHIFPDSKHSRSYKTKETHVCNFVKETFADVNISFDKCIQGGCSKRRPDIFLDMYTHSIIVEIDENQHQDYTCENKRMMQLFEDLGSRPLVMIRFNPDQYVNNSRTKIKSCFKYHKTLGIPIVNDKNMWTYRLDCLHDHIKHNIQNIPSKEVTIVNLFYDGSI
jgi:hypothetical protein